MNWTFFSREFDSILVCYCEFSFRERWHQVFWIIPESNLANIVKSKPLKNILKIKSSFLACRMCIERSESSDSTTTCTNLRSDLVSNSCLETCRWNFQPSPSALRMASLRKTLKSGPERVPFVVVLEIGVENVLDIRGIDRENYFPAERKNHRVLKIGSGCLRLNLTSIAQNLQECEKWTKYMDDLRTFAEVGSRFLNIYGKCRICMVIVPCSPFLYLKFIFLLFVRFL